jgi:hypothetical protein
MKAIILGVALVAGAANAQTSSEPEGCSRDTDCKSQRICVQRQCVWPGEPPSDQQQPGPPPPSDPQPPPPPPPGYYPPGASYPPQSYPERRQREPQRHHGLFLRLDIGFGYMSSHSGDGTDITLEGVAGAFSFAIGGTVARNQIIAFHIWDMEVTNPTLSSGGTSTSLGNNVSVGLLGLGPQYTVYSDSNWYFSATPSLTSLHHNDGNGDQSDSNWGFGSRLAVGKEWWVSRSWGLGLNASFSFSSNKDQNGGPTTTTLGTALNFSATWN